MYEPVCRYIIIQSANLLDRILNKQLCLTSQETLYLLWKPKVHYHVHRSVTGLCLELTRAVEF